MENQFTLIQSQESVITGLTYGSIFLVLLMTGLVLFFHYSRKKITQKELEKVNLKLSHQRQILQSTIATQERERSRIAQDLHDAISAKLNVISLTTHVLLENKDTTTEQKPLLSHILHVTTSTIENSRRLAHELLPPVLDKFGLKVALDEFVEDVTKTASLKVTSSIDDVTFEHKIDELHLFRIVQELMTNAIKHGKPKHITVTLEDLGTDTFKLCFKDDGKGFDIEKLDIKAGIGIQNIKSRVAILKSKLTVSSSPKKGSIFTITTKQHEQENNHSTS